MANDRAAGIPEHEVVSDEPSCQAHEEIQIIIYAQRESEEDRPESGNRHETPEIAAEEEEEQFPGNEKHNEVLTRTFDFSCPHRSCDFRSAKKSAVVLHVKAKHGLSGTAAVRKCPHCDHTTAHVSNLRTHILARHSQQRPWVCDHCNKRFADKSYYNAHLKRHRNDLRHLCSSCDLRFLLPSHLRAHMESRHSKLEVSYELCSTRLSPPCGFQRCMESAESHVETHELTSAGNSICCQAQPVPDHDYSLSAPPQRKGGLREVYECLACSSFFATIESLRVHSISEHGRK